MPHIRNRFAEQHILKLAKLWPVIGILGLRQSGKTTLLQKLFNIDNVISFDDFLIREEASKSPKTFLEKLSIPIVLDEIQKSPPMFDAIKLKVDQKRIPGSYFISGSTSFSNKVGIRESLTGRIGAIELLPMSMAELHEDSFQPINNLANPLNTSKLNPRYSIGEGIRAAISGGMPVPAFLRDQNQRDLYWKSWLETTILRDLSLFFPRHFDPDFAFRLLDKIAALLREGQLPTLKHFSQPARKIRAYLTAMEEIFLLRRIHCHTLGIGKEVWLLKDSGLASYLMGTHLGEGATLSLIRHFLWNELNVQMEYQGKRLIKQYYKSAQGSPIDFVIDNIPFRVVANVTGLTRQRSWEERPLQAAMKKLGSSKGFLIGPTDQIEIPAKNGIGILPWTVWS